MRSNIPVTILTLFLAGCTHSTKTDRNTFVEGKAVVLQVDNNLGMAMLQYDGKRTPAYWDTDITAPFRIAAVDSHQQNTAPSHDLTNSKDTIHPVTEHINLPAKPGDTIAFRAMRTGDELFLRYVHVVPN